MKLRGQELTWREVDGEMVLLDLRSSTYLTTNRTGTFLLRLLATDRTRVELVDAVVKEYEVPVERAAADTDAFLQSLTDRDLLEPS